MICGEFLVCFSRAGLLFRFACSFTSLKLVLYLNFLIRCIGLGLSCAIYSHVGLLGRAEFNKRVLLRLLLNILSKLHVIVLQQLYGLLKLSGNCYTLALF